MPPNSFSENHISSCSSNSETISHPVQRPAPSFKETWTSNVKMKTAQGKFWRIGNKYYDLTDFAPKHPGGENILNLARDRFGDCTYAFEAHHMNQPLVRKMLEKYKVEDIEPPPQPRDENGRLISAERHPDLLGPDAFYSVLRAKMHKYLKQNGGPGPTDLCIRLWWLTVVVWIISYIAMVYTGSYFVAAFHSMSSAVVGGFGHSWIHQPQRFRAHAYCLDFIGFSSECWLREHVLQHHMFTNSPLDNHFEGTAPFLVTDPRVKRSSLQKFVLPFVNPIILFFGIWGNYFFHTIELLKGRERFTLGKLIFPMQVTILLYTWGPVRGAILSMLEYGVCSIWYFTIALMNHNAEHCHLVKKRNKVNDWGHSQLLASCDMEPGLSFLRSIKYLWLNYHTMHHLFPHTDMSKHPGMQKILLETLKDFPDVEYRTAAFRTLYWEMITSFSVPAALGEEINLFPGNGYENLKSQ